MAKLPALQQEKSVPGGPVPVRDLPESQTEQRAGRALPEPAWPAAARAEVELPVRTLRAQRDTDVHGAGASVDYRQAGQLPVEVGRIPGEAAEQSRTAAVPVEDRVRVETFGQDASAELGLAGTLLRVTDVGEARAGELAVRIDYSGFEHAYGGDYGARLRLVRYPDCAVTTPERPECRKPTPVRTDNNQGARYVAAEVPLVQEKQTRATDASAPATMLLAVAADPSGPGGTFTATKLSPTGSWSAGGSSGAFSYSHPFDLPPSPSGDVPSLALGYSSSSLDGRTSTTNNQASVVGDGWELNGGGYIERRYRPCSEDLGGNQGQTETGDRCWAGDNATMVLGGTSTELVRDQATGTWRPENDDGSRIERLTGAHNGDDNGEHWKVTSTDGTQYFLGVNRLPGWSAGKPETHSTWSAPVFGNHAGEPCHQATFAASWCQQAWRWNLDYSVDPQGNVVTYYYGAETNHYGRNKTADAGTSYTRGGYLERVEYGLRSDDLYGTAAARVLFGMSERCLSDGEITCAPEQLGKDTAKSWPDVPFDQICDSGKSCDGRYAPTFFSRKRLTKVTTQIKSGPGWQAVNSWSLRHQFPESRDGSAPALWLAGITHTGKVGGSASTPELTFGGLALQNRVNADEDLPSITRYRIVGIRNETGGYTQVTYSEPDCRRGERMPANPESNTMRCYPTWWTPEYAPEPILDWFHRYVVTQVVVDDRTGGSAQMSTAYEYLGGAAWHFDDNDLAKPEHRTWSQWRGYSKVRTITGKPGTTQSVSETLYLRGMDGDRLPGGGKRDVWVTDSEGGRVEDHDRLAGFARETRQFDGDTVLSASVNDPWLRGPTASRGDDSAFLLDKAAVRGRTLLPDGSWRRTEVTRMFNDQGLITQVDDAGDLAVKGDETCTRTTYARSTTKWMLTSVSRERKTALPCADGEGSNADVISDVRTSYDGKPHGEPPTRGEPTLVERWDGTGYQLVTRTSYDAYGRTVERTDGAGAKASIEYSPATGPATKVTTTNALGHVSVDELAPEWGSPVAEVGPNGERTDAEYDPLGRLTKVWFPGQSKAAGDKPSVEYGYAYRTDAPTVVTTKSLRDDDGYNVSYDLYDGLLRERQTQIPASGGGRVLTDTWYDSRGLQAKTNAAYYNKQPPADTLHGVLDNPVPNQTITRFDALQQPIAVTYYKLDKKQWETRTVHEGDRKHVTPPTGDTPTTVITNAQGQVVERRQYHGDKPEGDYDATRYTYNRKGRLESLTDPSGNTWRYEYDVLGRKVKDIDPDRGTTTYTYDNLDRMASTTDSRGRTLTYTYDQLGRKTGMFEGGETGTKLAEWTYDTLKKGLPTASTRFVDGQAYTRAVGWYDDQNRVTKSQVTIPEREGELAGTYTFRAGYTPNTGRVSSTTMPAAGGLPAENIYHKYNELGLPTKTYGIDVYAQEHLYSPYGETLRVSLGSGAKQTWITNNYEEGTRRLAETILDRNTDTGQRIADRSYSYDPAGNITRIADQPTGGPSDVQCFRYDYLRRLTEAFTPSSGDCAADPTVPGLGGAAPYWQEFGYDKAGNRVTQTKHTAEGDVDLAFDYPAAGQEQPHTLRAVTRTGPDGTARDEFGYDSTGNTTSRTIGGDTQTLEWDAEGKLAKVNHADGQVSSYIYDAAGDRLIKREPNKVVLYLPGMELALNTGNGEVTGERFYEHGDATVAVRSSVGGVTMLMGDHQGTGTARVAATDGLPVTRRYFDPFGNPRGEEPESWPGDQGFVGGVDDATGLTHVGAREYDPGTGRFISADPLMDLTDPQQINGYAYASNSPVTFSDPTGLMMGAACGPDGILCGSGEAMRDPNYINNRTYWMRKRGYSESMVRSFQRIEGRNQRWRAQQRRIYAQRRQAEAQALREMKISQEEYKRLRAEAASKKTWWDHAVEQVPELAADLVGLTDVKDCFEGGGLGSCVSALVGALPIGKIFKALKNAGKLVAAVIDGFRWERRVAAARARLAAVGAAAKRIFKRSGCNSFAAGTLVVMADGSRRAIEDVRLGDEVLAADPVSGESGPREVVATIVGRGAKDLVELTVAGERPGVELPGTVVATEGHPFWVPELREWVPAASVEPGTWLRTGSGSWVQVLGVRSWTAVGPVYNLTVSGIHTYHVAAGNTEILNHNCPAGRGGRKARIDPQAEGSHTVIKRNADDEITGYTTYKENPANPNGFDIEKRVDVVGGPHVNKKTLESVPTPHVQGPGIPGGVRPAEPWEVPGG